MNQAYILIGSNVHKKMNYPKALRRLRAIGTVLAISSVYETVPIGNNAEESFYNGAALLETELDARVLKRALRIIEMQLGRVRTANPYAPRTIDLDIVLFNHDTINDADLHVPDPLILKRPFLALALAEISPGYVHPTDGRTLAEIARGLGEHPVGIRLEPAATANARQIIDHIYRGELAHA
jgi:dihydroneopterin aldolase/2-amino-4-hydroxy-6-hydroxymethyldihydropteridine diphosphokinase